MVATMRLALSYPTGPSAMANEPSGSLRKLLSCMQISNDGCTAAMALAEAPKSLLLVCTGALQVREMWQDRQNIVGDIPSAVCNGAIIVLSPM